MAHLHHEPLGTMVEVDDIWNITVQWLAQNFTLCFLRLEELFIVSYPSHRN